MHAAPVDSFLTFSLPAFARPRHTASPAHIERPPPRTSVTSIHCLIDRPFHVTGAPRTAFQPCCRRTALIGSKVLLTAQPVTVTSVTVSAFFVISCLCGHIRTRLQLCPLARLTKFAYGVRASFALSGAFPVDSVFAGVQWDLPFAVGSEPYFFPLPHGL